MSALIGDQISEEDGRKTPRSQPAVDGVVGRSDQRFYGRNERISHPPENGTSASGLSNTDGDVPLGLARPNCRFEDAVEGVGWASVSVIMRRRLPDNCGRTSVISQFDDDAFVGP
jgi:hypothetical protein